MLRYQKYNYLVQTWQISKLKLFNLSNLIKVVEINIQAGHFKPNNMYVEHGLLVANIAGQIPKVERFKHGKRLRHTLLITVTSTSKWKWAILDKFFNVILPMIGDLRTPKFRKAKLIKQFYSWRIRNFFEWFEADILLSDRVLKKEVYLPLYFNILLSNNNSYLEKEHILRMYRMPIILYNKYRPLAGDDLA